VHFAALAGIVVTGTFLAYYFNGNALRYLGAGITGTYIYTQPVFAVLIAILLLGESFTWQKLVAALLIFSGVYFVSFRKKKPLAT
jgi:drug/metabolite transporter (DMT)-like permease